MVDFERAAALWPDVQAFLRHCVDAAVQLGADCVAGPICEAPGRLRLRDAAQCRREFDLAVKNLRRAAAYVNGKPNMLALCSFVDQDLDGNWRRYAMTFGVAQRLHAWDQDYDALLRDGWT